MFDTCLRTVCIDCNMKRTKREKKKSNLNIPNRHFSIYMDEICANTLPWSLPEVDVVYFDGRVTIWTYLHLMYSTVESQHPLLTIIYNPVGNLINGFLLYCFDSHTVNIIIMQNLRVSPSLNLFPIRWYDYLLVAAHKLELNSWESFPFPPLEP